MGGAADSEELSVGGRIPRGLALVVSRGDHLLSAGNYCADGDFSFFGGSLSLLKGKAHQVQVSYPLLGESIAIGSRAAGLVVEFKFFEHEPIITVSCTEWRRAVRLV
jgi:hypothetical protein